MLHMVRCWPLPRLTFHSLCCTWWVADLCLWALYWPFIPYAAHGEVLTSAYVDLSYLMLHMVRCWPLPMQTSHTLCCTWWGADLCLCWPVLVSIFTEANVRKLNGVPGTGTTLINSVSDPDPQSVSSWIRIRIWNTERNWQGIDAK
jgi:hypothetical protein